MIPSFEKFMYPVLEALRDGKPCQRDDLRNRCITLMRLTPNDLQERITSNKKLKIVDRLQWATYYLLKSGYISRPEVATEQITPAGLIVLEDGATSIDRQYLRAHSQLFKDFEIATRESSKEKKEKKMRKKSIEKTTKGKGTVNKKVDSPVTTSILGTEEPIFMPIDEQTANKTTVTNSNVSHVELSIMEERIKQISEIHDDLHENLIQELLNAIDSFDESSFRQLLKELMPQMGYSSNFEPMNIGVKSKRCHVLSGIIDLDELGLNRFYVLANNNTDNEISLIEVQSFQGMLSTIGINMGVYITTSTFSEEAKDYCSSGQIRIKLIDGRLLAELMIKHNLGVITRETFEVKQLDQEFLFTHLTQY